MREEQNFQETIIETVSLSEVSTVQQTLEGGDISCLGWHWIQASLVGQELQIQAKWKTDSFCIQSPVDWVSCLLSVFELQQIHSDFTAQPQV